MMLPLKTVRLRMSSNEQLKLIEQNAKWVKSKIDETVYSLNYETYKAQIDTNELESKKYEAISNYNTNLTFDSTSYEKELIAQDTTDLEEKRVRWHESLSKDVYIEEALNVLEDLKTAYPIKKVASNSTELKTFMSHKSNSLKQLALQKFKKDFWGVFSFYFIVLVGLVSVFAYVFAPDDSQYANQMHLAIHSKRPGFKVTMLTIPSKIKVNQSGFDRLFFGKKNTDTEIPISAFEIKDTVLIYKEYASDGLEGAEKTIKRSAFPNNSPKDFIQEKSFLFGTDKYGRDLISRVLVGARISFFIGFVAVMISLLIGIFMGSIAGYFGGKVDAIIMWIINVTWSIPTLLLVIAITLALGKGFWQVFIAVGLTMWVEVARVVRGQIISAKEMQYVTAARALGFNDFRIITKHILPNIMAPVIVISAANFAAAILIESGLSFLGIGAQPPMASWGAMIKDHYNYIILGKPYLAIIPGLCIMSLVMAFMLIGNALRDALDVKN